MKNFLKKIFTGRNYTSGLLTTMILATVSLAIYVMGWEIVFIPLGVIGIIIIGSITNYIMNKLTNLNNNE